jgi:hypothetical protein
MKLEDLNIDYCSADENGNIIRDVGRQWSMHLHEGQSTGIFKGAEEVYGWSDGDAI